MENVTQHRAFRGRQLEAFRLSIGAAAAIIAFLMPGQRDTALGQGSGGFLQPTITADYLREIRKQAQEYDEARNQSPDPKENVSTRARGRAEDYARSLFDFSRTEAAQPRQYTTYDEITRPSLFPGTTRTPETTLNQLNYEDYYAASLRNDPKSSASDLATSRSTFNPYEDFQRAQEENPYRQDLLQAGASTGRFGAQTIELSTRPLQTGRRSDEQAVYDNINLDLVTARMGAIAGLSYTDNALFLSGSEKQSDLIAQMAIRVTTRHQITKDNMLNFQIGVGYTEYLLNPELNDIIGTAGLDLEISPTSRLAWETSIGNVFFTLFDTFGLAQQQNDQFLAQQEDYQVLTNTIGAAASWQANRTTSYTAALSRTDRMALDPIYTSNDTISYNFVGDIEYSPGQEWVAGRNQIWTPSAAGSWIAGLSTSVARNERIGGTTDTGTIAPKTESTTISIGPHLTTALSKFTRVRIGVGWQFAEFIDPTSGDANFDEPFYTVDVFNNLNRFTSQSLRIGHEAGLNDITNGLVADFVRHSFDFNISPRTGLATTAYYEHQVDSYGPTQEIIDRYGAAINLRHRLNSQVTLFLGYNFGQSDSTLIKGTPGPARDPNNPTLFQAAPGSDLTQETFSFDIAFPFAREIDLVLGFRRIRSVSTAPGGSFVENRGSINFSYNF